jgi:hypothetical protein
MIKDVYGQGMKNYMCSSFCKQDRIEAETGFEIW